MIAQVCYSEHTIGQLKLNRKRAHLALFYYAHHHTGQNFVFTVSNSKGTNLMAAKQAL